MNARRTLLALATGGIAGALAGRCALRAWLARKQPQTAGLLLVPGLGRPASVLRDAWGLRHVYAADEADLFLALGLVMAQDRLWQMDLLRRAARGELSAVAGRATLPLDRHARTIGFGRIAAAQWAHLAPPVQIALERFAAGVNAHLDWLHGRRGAWPPEFDVLRYRPAPWSPTDSLAIVKLLGWFLSGSLETGIFAAAALEHVGVDGVRALFPDYPPDAPRTVPSPPGGWAQALAAPRAAERHLRELLGMPARGTGSNAWAVAATRSASGHALLANDPHLELQQPARLYEAHLVAGELDVYGALVPGTVSVVSGHNGRIAWGVTNVGALVCDLYAERLSDESPARAWYVDHWEPLGEVAEQIAVRGGAAEVMAVRFTRHGPLVSAPWPEVGGPAALALRWTGMEPSDEVSAQLAVVRATDWESFNAALDGVATPALNVAYADAAGNIGYRCAGRVPLRPAAAGVLPVPGWDGAHEWQGYVPAAAMPRCFNPPAGWVATANNAVAGPEYPYPLSALWEPPYRARRIHEVLASAERLDADACAALQADVVSLHARDLLPALRRALHAAPGHWSAVERAALALLDGWDGTMAAESPATAVWGVFYQRWMEAALTERLPPPLVRAALELPRLNVGHTPWQVADDTLDGRNVWLRRDRREELARECFAATVRFLGRRQGRDPRRWRWGALHQVRLRHPLSSLPLLGRLLDVGPAAHGGDAFTVQASEAFPERPFGTALAAPFRLVVDFADLDATRAVLCSGQSGLPGIRHYADQFPLWLRGQHRRVPYTRAAVEAAAVAWLSLWPAGAG
ncbi:MAG: penicillin acylase family protein [Chloroflexi bacterium]|nr:penicillin acylase family protein [Chloroflexota bacterium]